MTLTIEAIFLFLIFGILVYIALILFQSINKQQIQLSSLENTMKSAIKDIDLHLKEIEQSINKQYVQLGGVENTLKGTLKDIDLHLLELEKTFQNASKEQLSKLSDLKNTVEMLRHSLEESIKFE